LPGYERAYPLGIGRRAERFRDHEAPTVLVADLVDVELAFVLIDVDPDKIASANAAGAIGGNLDDSRGVAGCGGNRVQLNMGNISAEHRGLLSGLHRGYKVRRIH
jgi:hypothetical protein